MTSLSTPSYTNHVDSTSPENTSHQDEERGDFWLSSEECYLLQKKAETKFDTAEQNTFKATVIIAFDLVSKRPKRMLKATT